MPFLLLVVDTLEPGGAERHVVDLAKTLTARGWRVDVACSAGGHLAGELSAAAVPVHVLDCGRAKRETNLRYAHQLRQLVVRLQPDLVHAHIHASEVAAAVALDDLTIPLVLTEHTEAPWRSPRDRAWASRAGARADLVVAVSAAVARRVVTDLEVHPEQVALVLPAVLTPLRPTRRAPRRGPATVGYVGRLAPEKGVDLLLEAFLQVQAQLPFTQLVVAGGGPEATRLTQLAQRVPRVHMLGFRRDVPDVLEGVDVLAVPSLSDGSPLVVAEANAAGTPVVASRVGGLPDRVRDGVDGVLVEPGDVAGLAEALAGVLSDEARRRRLARAGRERAERETYEAMLDQLERLYEQVSRSAVPAASCPGESAARAG